MKIAVIGTGRVGSTTAFCLAESCKEDELILINRTKAKADGLKADLMGAFPELGGRIKTGTFSGANSADILLVACGAFGAPAGQSLFALNKPVIQELFSQIKPKRDAKLVVITTPCDLTAHLAWKLSGLDSKNVVGFGGQLDVNRLKYLIAQDTGDFSKELDVHFIGEHGKRGIPVFKETVSDNAKIVNETRNYFSLYLSAISASTYGTAKELARLVCALKSEKGEVLGVSYFDEKNGIFVTWPCLVSNQGVNRPVELQLTAEETQELGKLIELRKAEAAALL